MEAFTARAANDEGCAERRRHCAPFSRPRLLVAAACTSIAHGSDNGAKFTITNTISSSSTTQLPALLLPGVPRYLVVHRPDPSSTPITVTSLRISGVPQAPLRDAAPQLERRPNDVFGFASVHQVRTNSVPVPIELLETHQNQDSCENKSFRFAFSAPRRTTWPARPRRSWSPRPRSVHRRPIDHLQRHGRGPSVGSPTTPSGTVTFFDGSMPIAPTWP